MEARRASFALFDSSRSRDAPVNYLVYPYVEVNGKPWENVANQFAVEDQAAGN